MVWHNKTFQYSILILLAFVWGSSFILMKIGLKSFTSDQAAAIRIVSASLALLPVSLQNIKHLKKRDLKSLLIAGFVGSFIPAFLFTKAQTRIDSAMAGILNSLTPIFTLIIGLILYKAKVIPRQVLGLVLGLGGALGLIITGETVDFKNINSYAFFIVLATTCYGVNINEIKANLSHLSGAKITSLSFMFLLPVALVYLLSTDLTPAFASEGWPWHLAALVTLGVIGTAVAMLLMNSLIRYVPAIYASSVTYIIPIFAIMWGVIDGEKILPIHVLFMFVILLGVYLVNSKGLLGKVYKKM